MEIVIYNLFVIFKLKKINIMNMSYCRFENTSNDLEDCIEAIENEEINDLGVFEVQALERLLEQAKTILSYRNEIEEGIEKSKNNLN